MLLSINLGLITNTFEGIQSCKKRLKLIHYFKDKIGSNGVLFVQEIHSKNIKEKWKKGL